MRWNGWWLLATAFLGNCVFPISFSAAVAFEKTPRSGDAYYDWYFGLLGIAAPLALISFVVQCIALGRLCKKVADKANLVAFAFVAAALPIIVLALEVIDLVPSKWLNGNSQNLSTGLTTILLLLIFLASAWLIVKQNNPTIRQFCILGVMTIGTWFIGTIIAKMMLGA